MYKDGDLELDFEADFAAVLRVDLVARGYNPPQDDERVYFAYFNMLKRLVPETPRDVRVATGLAVPHEVLAGFNELVRKIKGGEDLRAHLSKKITDIKYDDLLLNDWGFHHLHLGTRLDAKGFVDRTGPVLFARFEIETAFLIAIGQHGEWSNLDLLTSFVRTWPEVADKYSLRMTHRGSGPTSDDIATLRKKHGQALVVVDGHVFAPIGGGISSAGVGVEVVSRSDRVRQHLWNLEKAVVAQSHIILGNAAMKGYPQRRPVRLRLSIEADQSAYALSEDRRCGCRLGPIPI